MTSHDAAVRGVGVISGQPDDSIRKASVGRKAGCGGDEQPAWDPLGADCVEQPVKHRKRNFAHAENVKTARRQISKLIPDHLADEQRPIDPPCDCEKYVAQCHGWPRLMAQG